MTLEKLVSFKQQFAIETVELNHLVKIVFPVWDDKTIDKFFQMQSNYLIGLFPYTSPTPIQKEAMEQLGIDYKSLDFKCITRIEASISKKKWYGEKRHMSLPQYSHRK
ncbi:hypothetical protein [Paenibacillus wynnii]|uniref:hypothetical protein n=1 Tax=Paenibacillus wynnii TaxID=268407 RepID=UPI00278FC5C5|nr:hypothetical protein [Paenibacillus wynnii]MDQ0193545.1 hypothetical protein [Paenibacillus wynnii]